MKDAIELHGYTSSKGAQPTYILVPSGNHRNQQKVLLQPGPPTSRARCPRCKGALLPLVHTFPTEEYKTWTKTAVQALQARYYTHQFKGPVIAFCWVFGGRGFTESRDWDNVQKCVGDALVAARCLAPPAGLPDLASGKEREGDDDVRSIKGWRTWYLNREEHFRVTGGAAAKKPDDLQARLFVQLVDASDLDPFRL